MIAARIVLRQPNKRNRWIDESPINAWMVDNVGTYAKFRDLVDESRPWHVEHTAKELIYSFAREQDAIMFALKFS
jgi:hypothetical protein